MNDYSEITVAVSVFVFTELDPLCIVISQHLVGHTFKEPGIAGGHESGGNSSLATDQHAKQYTSIGRTPSRGPWPQVSGFRAGGGPWPQVSGVCGDTHSTDDTEHTRPIV